MNTISNLWNGRFGLAKTYWLWGVLSGIPWGIALSLITPGSNPAILAALAFVVYYVIVHVGYALTKLDPEETAQTLALFAEAGIDPAGALAGDGLPTAEAAR